MCAQCGWKMAQFKGMGYDEIMLHYYSGFRRNQVFLPIGSEAAEQWSKEHNEYMAACKENVKKAKMDSSTSAAEQVQKDSNDMFLIELNDIFIEPAQARRQIVDWEVTDDNFLKAWKIVRVGGEWELYRDFEDLVRSCNRTDIHALWDLVKKRNLQEDPLNEKEMEL